MRKILINIEKIPHYWILGIVLIYGLIMAEYYYTLSSKLVIGAANQLVSSSFFVFFMSFNFFLMVLSAFIVWIISSLLLYLILILFGGESIFENFKKISALCYIFPTISFILSFLLLEQIEIYEDVNIDNFLTMNKTMIKIGWIINIGFILYYLFLWLLLKYQTGLNWVRSLSVIIVPLGSIYLLGKLFSEYIL